jgi:hypothetical protein
MQKLGVVVVGGVKRCRLVERETEVSGEYGDTGGLERIRCVIIALRYGTKCGSQVSLVQHA